MPTILLVAQVAILLALLGGYVVVHYGPKSLRNRVANYYDHYINTGRGPVV